MIGLSILAACSSSASLPTVESVDLKQYSGTWYDVAHLPQSFQRDCKCVRAEYQLQGEIMKIKNICVDKKTNEKSTVEGEAEPVKNSNNSRLKVHFTPLFEGDYYIIDLQEDYSYALVGSPDRESLWVLSRQPKPAAYQMKLLLNKAESLGFDTSKLVYTDQSCYTSK